MSFFSRALLASFFLLTLSFAAIPAPASGLSSGLNTQTQSNEAKRVLLRLHADVNAAIPGEPLRLAIEQTITPGWHTYWTNSGDSGEAMRIQWNLPEGYAAHPLSWPAPERIPYGPLMNYGYHDHAVILGGLDVPANAKIGSALTINGTATVLVCDEICIPETHDITLTLPVAQTNTPTNEALFADAATHIPPVLDWKTHTEYAPDEIRVRITVPRAQSQIATQIDDIIWFPHEWGLTENAADQLATYEPTTRTLTLRQARAQMPRDISQIKNASYVVRTPDAAFIVGGTIAAVNVPTMFEGQPQTAPANTALWLMLIFAFLGGIILNIMPCVFPVLSMKAMHLVSMPREERLSARLNGLSYSAGVISMFLLLAVLLFSLRAAGTQLGWGFQLQNPAIVAGLAWLMFVIGLNLAGTFDLRVAFGGDLLRSTKHHPLLSSFFTGVLATMVAAPCSAPFMATAMGAALVLPAKTGALIFAFVGLGLAFPFLLLSFAPLLQRVLPRPGAWMETFRTFLAFPMYASAVWLVWVVAQQGGAHAVGVTLGGMVAIAFAIWLFARNPERIITRYAVMALGILVVLGTLYSLGNVAPKHASAPTPQTQNTYFKPYDSKSFENAIRVNDGPVFVNMTAAWCITCLVNEKVVLNTNAARRLFADNNVTYFKGDWTNHDESITAFLQNYGRTGVPLYVFFPAADALTAERPAAIVLPQILTIDEIRGLF